MFSNPPTSSPAAMAPGIDPRPPMTVTIRPLTVSGTVISGDSTPTADAVIAPATPPSRPANTKVVALVRCTSMPQSCAATSC